MLVGEVIGNIWATKKYETLEGQKFLIIKIQNEKNIVAVDSVGAGIGEQVIIATGGAARTVFEKREIPVDAVIVGIIDEIEK